MRKHFLKVSLIGLLAVSMPMSFTSCKDYDDDIEALENSNADLSNQLSALQAALTANQQAATAAQTAADAAKAAADEAKQEAELAKKAAAEAKAEAIEEAIDQVKSMLSGYATSAQLATLAGTVEGIQKGLSTLEASLKEANAEIDENARAIEAIKVQVAALEKFQAETGKDITAIKADIEALKAQLNSKITKDEVNALLNEANSKLTRELNSAVSTLQGVISNRLSSITLVPNLYIDGIETIEFVSLQYENKDKAGDVVLISTEENEVQYRLNPTTVGESDIDAANINFVALQATARGVVEAPIAFAKFNGIDKNGIMSIYAKKANTKSLNLGGNQIYTVAVEVPIAKDLCDAENPDQKVYSEYARLYEGVKEPHIAKKPYTCPAGQADCESGLHYFSKDEIWAASVDKDECVVKEVNYNETLDLRTLVTGCAIEEIITEGHECNLDLNAGECNHETVETVKYVATQMTAAELAKYGLEFRFFIPTEKYNTDATNKTNQQVFGALKEDGYTIYSVIPKDYVDDNKDVNRAAIDKQPIVCVELVDVKNGNKVADRRYFKIKWTEKAQVPEKDMPTLTIATWEHPTENLPCEQADMYLNWQYFIEAIYARELRADIQVPNEDGTAYVTKKDAVVKPDMSHDEFCAIYPEYKVAITGANKVQTPIIYSDVNADANALSWSLTAKEIGNIVNIYDNPEKNGRHDWNLVDNSYTATITWYPVDPKKYATIKLEITRTFDIPWRPEFYGFYENYWRYGKMGEQYPVFPVQYGSDVQKNVLKNEKCIYHNNIMNAFAFDPMTNHFIYNLSPCPSWDLQFCSHKGATYKPAYIGNEPDCTGIGETTTKENAGYKLYKGTELASTLTWGANVDGEEHDAWCVKGHKEVIVDLNNNAAGQGLLNDKDAPDVFTHVGIWTSVNDYNVVPAWDYDMYFVEPLDIKTAELGDELYDGIVNGSKINWRDVFSMKDCFGYLVAEKAPVPASEKEKYAAELYDYYGVQTPVWNTIRYYADRKASLIEIRFGFKKVGNDIVVDNTIEDENGAMKISTLESLTSGGSIPSLLVYDDEPEALYYFSNMGSQVNSAYNIWAKVTVSYDWGSAYKWVKIKVNPMQAD